MYYQISHTYNIQTFYKTYQNQRNNHRICTTVRDSRYVPTRRKKTPPGAQEKPAKIHVVSVRPTDEQYQTVVENCRLYGRKLSDYWRRALLNAKVTAISTPEDMAILRQFGSMAKTLVRTHIFYQAIIPDEILIQKKQCETAHKELQEEDMKYSLAQISPIVQ